MLDIPAVAEIAHDAGVPLLIDNTFATPYLSRPIEWGADIVDALAHQMDRRARHRHRRRHRRWPAISTGRASGKFPTLTEPYAGYHGLVFAEQFGPAAFVMRARTEGLRDFGACLSPNNAVQLLQGVETLSLRMERTCANTHAVLAFLTKNPAVDWVLHPSLDEPSRSRSGEAPAAARRRLDRQLRHQGRARGGARNSSRR